MSLIRYPVLPYAYVVDDMDSACLGWIELIGAGMFDENDPDWPCDEVWEPVPRNLFIPVGYSGENWESCLQRLRALVLKEFDADSPAARMLQSSQGIGIGFVDGDLEIIWKP